MTQISNKPSVLIVEDERIVAMDLQQTLAGMGYDPFAIASSADETIARVSERCPDIVLMDIRIKGPRDGIQTAEILKKSFDIPVVYLTAHADSATIARAKLTEPHGYLLKPVKSAELQSSIEVSLFKHQMEKRLRERERWLSTTLRSVADAVLTVDVSGRVTFLNPAAETLIGLPAAQVLGKPAREILRLVDAASVARTETPLDMALRVMHPVELHEASLLDFGNGSQRIINDSATPVVDSNSTLGAVMVFRDVTEKRILQKRLEFADRLTSLGTMAAGTAHELNNPLGIVIASVAMAADDLKRLHADLTAGVSLREAELRTDDIAVALADAEFAASRMARIISDLRAFSRPVLDTSGPVDLTRCVEWAARATAHEFRQRARLVTQFGEVPRVQANEARLGQVIINLLVNASQAIPPGNADRNEISITTYTDDRGWAVAKVGDTGAGIPADVLPRVFDPFFTTKDIGTGTGLGLSICHGIVGSFGGKITVDSQVGKGTTFCVSLPPATVAPGGADPSILKTTPLLSGRILVVDDEEMLLRIIGRTLKRQDHQAVCVESASEALALIESGERFDLILSDLTMPNVTGVEFYEALMSHHPHLARRMVFMTGGATTAKVGDFLQSVRNPMVEKPFTPKILLETIQQALEAEQCEPARAS